MTFIQDYSAPHGAAVDGHLPSRAVENAERIAALEALDILDTPPEDAFDNIVAAASELCDTPIALVSLVDKDRQWFKARRNFLPEQTNLDRSVCAHTLLSSDVLVIPDLSRDPRTASNPLVTGPEAIRFYAGAPLVTTDGFNLGALCVIDTVPRPDGLSDKQTSILRHLAQQTVMQIELRSLITQRDDLVGHLRESRDEAAEERRRLDVLFENGPSFIALQWGPEHVFQKINPAYRTLVGGRDIVGHRVRDVLPDAVEQGFLDILDTVYRTGEPYEVKEARWVSLADPDAPEERFLDFIYQPVRENGRVKGIFTIGYDVTERVLQVRRQVALADLSEQLRAFSDPEEVTHAAAQIMAEALGATRAGVGTVDPERETVLMHRNWCTEGAVPVEGAFRFRDYGSFIEDLKRGHMVVIEDPARDPRTSATADALAALGIRTLLNFPVIERGRFVLVAFVHFARPRKLSPDDIAFVQQVADRTQSALSHLQAEAHQRTLNQELAHRMKNTLAMVQAITTQTLRSAANMEEGRLAIANRLTALARAQDILVHGSTDEADVRDVLQSAIAPHRDKADRITMTGPRFRITSQQALGLSMAVHELATNAAKYGALSDESGRVDMTWDVADGAFTFRWIESGGPRVISPQRQGFGSRLIERIVGSYFDGTGRIDYDPAGLRFELKGAAASRTS